MLCLACKCTRLQYGCLEIGLADNLRHSILHVYDMIGIYYHKDLILIPSNAMIHVSTKIPDVDRISQPEESCFMTLVSPFVGKKQKSRNLQFPNSSIFPSNAHRIILFNVDQYLPDAKMEVRMQRTRLESSNSRKNRLTIIS